MKAIVRTPLIVGDLVAYSQMTRNRYDDRINLYVIGIVVESVSPDFLTALVLWADRTNMEWWASASLELISRI